LTLFAAAFCPTIGLDMALLLAIEALNVTFVLALVSLARRHERLVFSLLGFLSHHRSVIVIGDEPNNLLGLNPPASIISIGCDHGYMHLVAFGEQRQQYVCIVLVAGYARATSNTNKVTNKSKETSPKPQLQSNRKDKPKPSGT
jgi:hypothetical protein